MGEPRAIAQDDEADRLEVARRGRPLTCAQDLEQAVVGDGRVGEARGAAKRPHSLHQVGDGQAHVALLGQLLGRRIAVPLTRDQPAEREADQRGLQHARIDAPDIREPHAHHAVRVPAERHVEQALELLLREVRVHDERHAVVAGGEGQILGGHGAGEVVIPAVVDVAGASGGVRAHGDAEGRVCPVLNVAAQARGLEQRLPVVRDVLGLAGQPEQLLLERGIVDDDGAHAFHVAGLGAQRAASSTSTRREDGTGRRSKVRKVRRVRIASRASGRSARLT